MSDAWQPNSVRHAEDPVAAAAEYASLSEGVPPSLVRPLSRWVYQQTQGDASAGRSRASTDRIFDDIRTRLDMPLPDDRPGDHLSARCEQDAELMLDVLDFLLAFEIGDARDADRLGQLLRQARSVWMVLPTGSTWCLSRRVEAAVDEAIVAELGHGGSASHHLSSAWAAAYGRNPDPSKAYGQAVLAVEVAAGPVVTPKDGSPTLGTIAAALRDGRANLGTRLQPAPRTGRNRADSVGAVIEMCGTLWQSQKRRHGDVDSVETNTQEEAEDAVHLALLLVQWFRSGAIQRTS